jgi:hypothetical protein
MYKQEPNEFSTEYHTACWLFHALLGIQAGDILFALFQDTILSPIIQKSQRNQGGKNK